jgi:hypothetical protein
MQDEFLRPPVQQLADPEYVLGRAGQRVNPTELLELLAAPAGHAEKLAIEAELIDAAPPGGIGHLTEAAGLGRQAAGSGT